MKSTVPVGVPAPTGTPVTVAVNVTDWPRHAGLADELRAVALPINWAEAGPDIRHIKAPTANSDPHRERMVEI